MSASFDRQPTLQGERVLVRPLRRDDYDALYAVASDPLLWEQHPARNRHEEPVYQALFRESLDSGGALSVIDRVTERIVGSSRYHGHDPVASEIEIGWTYLARAYWGGAWNGELKRLMLAHAFRFVDRVVFRVAPENLRSQRALEKIGAVQVGVGTDATGRESIVFALRSERHAATGDPK